MTAQVHGISVRGRSVFAPRVHSAVWIEGQRPKPMLRISLLDGVALHIDGREVALSSRKARALIAYLVLAPGMKETRDRLCGLLWSETDQAKARASLRQLLHLTRELLDNEGFVGLSSDKLHVRLDASTVTTDLDHALANIDQGEPGDSLLYGTPAMDAFLRGYDEVDSAFASWLAVRRESLRQLLVERLEAQLSNAPHIEATKRIARALLQMDPAHEIACQALMRTHVACGNVGAALAAYKQLWDCLEREYDVEPSPVTQALLVAIRSGNYSPPSASAGNDAGLREEPSRQPQLRLVVA
jgi:DNA-binding SARP family transcriptional activator